MRPLLRRLQLALEPAYHAVRFHGIAVAIKALERAPALVIGQAGIALVRDEETRLRNP